MSSCQNKPIRGQVNSSLTNERAQLGVQIYSAQLFTYKVSSVSVAGLIQVLQGVLLTNLFTERLQSISISSFGYSTNTFVWARRNLSFEFYYKQEEQFSLTVKCNNWLPIFVLWPRHYFVFLVIVLTFY